MKDKDNIVKRNGIWDLLRALAALLVMFHHYTANYDIYFGHVQSWPLRSDYGGMLGVCLFFILTGFFLVPSLEHSANIIQYAKKRFIRLYPSYWICLIITFCIILLFPLEGRNTGVKEFVINFTMLQSYLGVENVDGAYWTLGVQIYIYIVFSLLYFFVCKKDIILLLKVLILWFALNSILLLSGVDNSYIKTLFQVSYIHLFIQGIVLFFIIKKKSKHPFYFLFLLLSVVYSYWSVIPEYCIINAIDVAIILLLGMNNVSYYKKNLLTYLGVISYTIYLLHQNIGYVIIRQMESIGLANEVFIIIPIGIIIIIATFIYEFIETPITIKFK